MYQKSIKKMIKIFRNFDQKNKKQNTDFDKQKNKIEYDMNQLFNKLQRNRKRM